MKKRQLVCLIAFILLALIIPSNVGAKEITNKKVACEYEYQDKKLTYGIYDNDVSLPFINGENDWYHGQDFAKTYVESAKTNSINYVCPTITIEENSSFTTVFNNPVKEEDCNGKCTTLVAKKASAKENITVKKAVATTAISSVGIYNDAKYFIPYFRLLEDGTKEWSINGKMFIPVDTAAVVATSKTENTLIKLDQSLINKIYNNQSLNENTTIYRNVRKVSDDNYEYLLSTTKNAKYQLTDGQETKAASYKAAYGDQTQGTDGWLDGYDQQQDCSGSAGLLGSYDDEDSVAWLLQKIFNYIKILGPFIVVVMSGIDFAKVIVTGDDDGMKKAKSKLITRLLLAASLFFLPDLISAVLELFNITSSGLCGLE